MSQVIPEGWVSSKLECVVDTIMGGGTPSKAISSYFQGDIPWMSVKDMNKNELVDTVDHISQEAVENSSTNVIPAGTPIVATRMSLGKIVTANFDSAINQDLKALFVNLNIEKPYFVYWYRSIANLIESLGTGTTVKGIRLEVLRGLDFPLPSIAEQKVIADKLDELLAQVESTKARLDAIPAILKSFRQSVLAVAVSGKLTEEWREIDDTSQLMSIDTVCHTGFDGPFGSKLKTADYTDSGVRVARLENVGHLNFIEEKQTFISEKKHQELIRNTLEENDILFSSFVEQEVRVCLFPKHNSTFINKADCFCLRVNDEIALPKFVVYVLASSSSYEQIKSNVQGVTRPRINLKILKSLTFRFPTLKEQVEIVRRVEELFVFAHKVEAQVNAAQERVNNLTQSILAKAFRGDLTADWRAANPDLISGDNSAKALLERIKAERVKLSTKSKPRKSKTKVITNEG
ncbi:restriction endonuclease subunit S [Vibrio sp. 10N.247.311.51]|uniref:restriction endonuclease subunit S n=1 Tax=Vibrio sp. 10N.247.311.51 TaxID=3229996 RepID=UPI00354C4880